MSAQKYQVFLFDSVCYIINQLINKYINETFLLENMHFNKTKSSHVINATGQQRQYSPQKIKFMGNPGSAAGSSSDLGFTMAFVRQFFKFYILKHKTNSQYILHILKQTNTQAQKLILYNYNLY